MKKGVIALLVVVGVVIFVGYLCSSTGTSTQSARTPTAPRATAAPAKVTTYSVVYSVRCTSGKASLTYRKPDGSTEQRDITVSFNGTWTQSYSFRPGQFAYISAQNRADSGAVTAKILVNNSVWREATSDGAYKIATVSGMIGTE